MAWQGTFRRLDQEIEGRDSWAAGAIGVIYQTDDDGEITIETTVDQVLVEDDGHPFQSGEQVEMLVRRVAQ